MSRVVKCKCGSTLFHRNYRTGGWWKQIIESSEDGTLVHDTDLDSVRNRAEPKTVKCAECGKTNPNPDYTP